MEIRVIEMGELFKDGDRQIYCNRESHFILSFSLLCVLSPCCASSFPLTLGLACHYPQQSVQSLITLQMVDFQIT